MFLFLLLLIVLVISVLMGNSIKMDSVRESFVSFQKESAPINLVKIPSYSLSTNVYKLYDNLFFDNKNGNVIEVDSTTYSGNVDITGKTITTTYVVPRLNSGSSVLYNTGPNGKLEDTQSSLISNVSSSYKSYFYSTQSKKTDNYYLFYFPWNDQTFIHIINRSVFSNISSFYFGPGNKMETLSYPKNASIGITSYVPFVMPTATNSLEPLYNANRPLFVVGQNVKYDIQNGNLIIQNTNDPSSKSVTVYNRDGSHKIYSAGGVNNPPESLTNVTFKPFYTVDNVGQNIVLYLPYQTTTIIALIGFSDANKTTFKINNVCRFTPTTIDNGPNAVKITPTPTSTKPPTISDYYKMPIVNNMQQKYSEDYLLKTQIVPPVCPSCPVCSTGTCTNCGGNGGSGTLSNKGNTVVSGNSIPANNQNVSQNNQVNQNNQNNHNMNKNQNHHYNHNNPNSIGGVVNRGIGAVEHIADDATGLIKGFGSGVKDILMQGNRNGTNGNNPYGQVNRSDNINRTEGAFNSPYGTQNIDQYSYYGALSNKGSGNFMPMTSDFSKFGR